MKQLAHYKNGNYFVTIFDDGTKIRENNLDFFEADFPESMDCKITNKCPMLCPMCHENSTPDGEHGDIMNVEFINKLRAGTEMAIGGGAVTSHPDLVLFLKKLKEIGVIPSITVHQKEFANNYDLISMLVKEKLIYGLGVSFSSFDDEFWDKVIKENPNLVVHLIAGRHDEDVFNYLANKNVKILILGYKYFGRGKYFPRLAGTTIQMRIDWLKNNLSHLMDAFKVISFDNLAIEQLNVKDVLTNNQWNEFYQGNDGTHTMYVDLVKKQFAKTSTSTERYPLLNNIDDMFMIIKKGQ